ncbi:MAG TPA: hypothetical protein PLJ78_14095 [Anaerolineae bacterium]|nr:hypothetical protein [Anaerolineae bacterium]HQK15063.1 hypothetical protein [Anaerolineae bacterium]
MSYRLQFEEIQQIIEQRESARKTHQLRESELHRQLYNLEEQLEQEQKEIQVLENDLAVLSHARTIYEILVEVEEVGVTRGDSWIIRQLEKARSLLPEPTPLTISEAIKGPLVDEWSQRYAQLYTDLSVRQVELYWHIAEKYESIGKTKKAIQALESARLICEKPDHKKEQYIETVQWLARLRREQIESVKDCLDAIELYEILNDALTLAHLWRNIAHYYEDDGNQSKALEAYEQCLVHLGQVNENHYALEQYNSNLEHIYRLGRGLGVPTEAEQRIYELAIVHYQNWNSVEGLDQVATLAEKCGLHEIKVAAIMTQRQILIVNQKASIIMQVNPILTSIPPELSNLLRETLSRCGPFSTDRELQAVFVDSRISPWRENVPQASSRAERVEVLINFLCDKHDARGENALILFLSVLKDRAHPGDACHQRLMNLVDDLRSNASPADASNTQPNPNAATIQNIRQELEIYERQLQRLKKQIASAGGEISAPVGLLEQHDQIAAKIESLQAELRSLER